MILFIIIEQLVLCSNALNAKFKSLGIISIMDLDDHWSPGPHHPAYLLIKNAEIDVKIHNND
jgi:hypothetical protein